MAKTSSNIITRTLRNWGLLRRSGESGEPSLRVYGASFLPPLSDGELYMAAVNRCVSLISEAVASMPPRRMQREAGGIFKAAAVDDRLTSTLALEPNIFETGFDFWRRVTTEYLLAGEVYIVPVRDNAGLLSALHIFTTGEVTVHDTALGVASFHNTERRLHFPTLPPTAYIHLHGNRRDGVTVRGLAAYLSELCNFGAAADNEARTRVETGGTPRFLLQREMSVYGGGKEQEASTERLMQEFNAKIDRRAGSVFVNSDLKATPISATAADMQFQSMREFAVREVCRFFGVPPTFVYCEGSSNYKSTEAASTDFITNTLDPILRCFEAELTRKLLPGRAAIERVEFDRATRIAADGESRARYFTQMLACGAFTPNEVRRATGHEPVDGGDTPLVSANLRPLTDTATIKTPQQ